MCYNNQGINFSYIKCHKSIATISPPILALLLSQFFFFFKFLPKISATWLSQFFFPPIFSNLVATIHIFSLLLPYNFGNLVATIHIPFRIPHLTQHLGHFTGELGAARISIISLLKFNFFSLLHHITFFFLSLSYFFLQFQQWCCRNSLFFLIFPNNFEQYLYHQ